LRRDRLATAGLLAILLGFVSPALAQEVQRIAVQLRVSHISQAPGTIDPAAADLDRHLRRDFNYKSLRLIEDRTLDLGLNEVGSLQLPTGRWVTVRPRNVGDTGVLLAVEVQGLLRTRLRVPNHHQVVIGAQSYDGGKLVISLEPRY
jgi:hypothetical protein